MKVKKIVLSQYPSGAFENYREYKKIWLLGEAFEPKLGVFSKNYSPLPQPTYFVIAPSADAKVSKKLTPDRDYFSKQQ